MEHIKRIIVNLLDQQNAHEKLCAFCWSNKLTIILHAQCVRTKVEEKKSLLWSLLHNTPLYYSRPSDIVN
jgi:hypothetical protein